MNVERFLDPGALAGGDVRRRGIRSPTPIDWPGLMPQVTVGSMRAASMRHAIVVARVGVGRHLRHHARARVERRAVRRERPALEDTSNVVSSGLT